MIVPNKVIRFSDSVIGKMPIILENISEKEMKIKELFFTTQNHFDEIDEFVYSLDVLYILDAIKVDFDKGVVTYVSKD
ncbi:hypothetical protein MOE00_02545 [Bacillus inaquosorum]|uniref:ABC-three component system middle component 7 n=1 Tax=Bacillus inaquosorum TaxID=483913 RepID=UPI00227DB50E|nr:ABC-three component system middle component 7 [Bacillus inaquosorum]MCY8175647.1 hypothetical protein [Bacillus inaquosorum]MCY8791210.1 hypothetical protein [Bacillus inaquosorum]MCY8845121.1 hypothetical protein [Bacillus inaquosorum]MCY9085930.1 hypothetical protein [Bacillus inaquosorum]